LPNFQPAFIDAAIGDTVQFQPLPSGCAISQSSFEAPCASNGLFDTDFLQTDSPIEIMVTTTTPQWFYGHLNLSYSACTPSMLFAINPGVYWTDFTYHAAQPKPFDYSSSYWGSPYSDSERSSTPLSPTETGCSSHTLSTPPTVETSTPHPSDSLYPGPTVPGYRTGHFVPTAPTGVYHYGTAYGTGLTTVSGYRTGHLMPTAATGIYGYRTGQGLTASVYSQDW
jgi:hypothetical protein